MSNGIHELILLRLQEVLQDALIDSIPVDDVTRAGVVKIGPLQGDPDPDVARISVELYYNDPDQTIGGGSSMPRDMWSDEVEEVEIGGSVTWVRRFTAKARCLLEGSHEGLSSAHNIASVVRSRIEKALLRARFGDIQADDEYVTRGIASDGIDEEVIQAGGPPDAYDFHIKIRFELLTTEQVGIQ